MTHFDLLHVSNGKVRTDLKCTGCGLCDTPKLTTNCMGGAGPNGSALMFVGYAPGQDDDKVGTPFVGPNGRLFDELLAESGIDRRQHYVTNCLKCAPYDQEIDEKYWKACRQHLIAEINKVKPKALVAVGARAFEWLTGYSGIKRFRMHSIESTVKPGLFVMPMQQPVALLHAGDGRKKLRQEMVDDLLWIRQRMDEGKYTQVDDVVIDYKVARTLKDVEDIFTELDQYEELACDLETSALFPSEGDVVVAIGFSGGPGHARVIPLYAWGKVALHFWTDVDLETKVKPKIVELFKKKKVYGHNWLQFDQKWLRFMFGIAYTLVSFDTMLAHYLTNEDKGTHDLEQLAVEHTNMTPWKKSFTLQDIDQLSLYLCKDVDATARIKKKIEPLLTDKQRVLLQRLLIPLGHTLMDMEYRGIPVDAGNIKTLTAYLKKRLDDEKAKIRAIPEVQAFSAEHNTEVNVNSPDHLATVLEHFLKLPCKGRTKTGQFSTAAWALLSYKDVPFIDHVLQVRGLSKLLGTYSEGIADRIHKDGRIHTSYLIHGTVTGRLASRDPNLQNIPREDTAEKVLEDGTMIKSVFKASPGTVFLQADYSQVELRTLAMYSKDPELVRIYKEGLDVHTATAAKVYNIPLEEVTKTQRTSAKSVNFGIIFGMTIESLQERFEEAGNSREEAVKFWNLHKESFPGVWSWMAEQEEIVRRDGYQETYFGRRRRYQWVDDHAVRQAYNYPIQSTASDFTLYAIVLCSERLKSYNIAAVPVLTVHDSILFEVEKSAVQEAHAVIQHTMENLDFWFINVPIKADFEVGEDWGHLEKYVNNN